MSLLAGGHISGGGRCPVFPPRSHSSPTAWGQGKALQDGLPSRSDRRTVQHEPSSGVHGEARCAPEEVESHLFGPCRRELQMRPRQPHDAWKSHRTFKSKILRGTYLKVDYIIE